jgi:ribose/xylose/arabinose/galactoside ABC-type transport system permease subunit
MLVPSFYQQIANGAILLLAVGLGRLRGLQFRK